MVVFMPAAVHVCVSDVMGQQEPEEEEELFDKPGDGEEDASDEDDEDYEDSIKNEDEEARGRSPTSLNFEGSSSETVEVMQRDQILQPWTPPEVSFSYCHVFYMLTLSITWFIVLLCHISVVFLFCFLCL